MIQVDTSHALPPPPTTPLHVETWYLPSTPLYFGKSSEFSSAGRGGRWDLSDSGTCMQMTAEKAQGLWQIYVKCFTAIFK